jgi:hypothetical protein
MKCLLTDRILLQGRVISWHLTGEAGEKGAFSRWNEMSLSELDHQIAGLRFGGEAKKTGDCPPVTPVQI